MDNKYSELMQNTHSSNALTINELSNTILEMETKLHESEKKNILLRKENEELKHKNNSGLHVQELEKTIVCNLNLHIMYIINKYILCLVYFRE